VQLTRESSGDHLIRACKDGAVRIGERWFSNDLIVAAEGIRDWPDARPSAGECAELGLEQLAPVIALEPEIVLLGTGARAIFPAMQLHAELAALRIGLEVMSTPAACRTFNVLVAEQRRVVAALWLGPEPAAGAQM
jgi:uncharacterized protein